MPLFVGPTIYLRWVFVNRMHRIMGMGRDKGIQIVVSFIIFRTNADPHNMLVRVYTTKPASNLLNNNNQQ